MLQVFQLKLALLVATPGRCMAAALWSIEFYLQGREVGGDKVEPREAIRREGPEGGRDVTRHCQLSRCQAAMSAPQWCIRLQCCM
jgi:hypothetical protein